MALPDTSLVNVATIEDELGISTGTETARLERYIQSATALLEGAAGRVFSRTTNISEKYAGRRSPYLILDRAPINDITSVSFLGSPISSTRYVIHDADTGTVFYINGTWERSEPLVHRDISHTIAPGNERKDYTVVYDAGWYTQPADDNSSGVNARALPYDIEQAAIAVVAAIYRQRGRDPSVVQESLLGSSQTWASMSMDDSDSWLKAHAPIAWGIMQKYRRIQIY